MAPHYGTGYDKSGRTNNNLPTHIKCDGRCARVKGSGSYSAKQLDILIKKLRDTSRFDAAKTPLISCTGCTSQQVVELRCFDCERWMGLDKFYKTQRKKPDEAECIECVTRRVETEPHEVGRDDDEDGYDVAAPGGSDNSDSDDYEDYHMNNATGSIAGLSISNSTYPSQTGASSTGGVNVTGSTAATSRQSPSAQASSVAGTASTVRTATTKFNPRGYASSSKSTGGGGGGGGGAWAKVPAGRSKAPAEEGSDDDDDDDDRQLISDSD